MVERSAKVNLAERLTAVGAYFSSKIVAYMNELKIEVVKIRGNFVFVGRQLAC